MSEPVAEWPEYNPADYEDSEEDTDPDLANDAPPPPSSLEPEEKEEKDPDRPDAVSDDSWSEVGLDSESEADSGSSSFDDSALVTTSDSDTASYSDSDVSSFDDAEMESSSESDRSSFDDSDLDTSSFDDADLEFTLDDFGVDGPWARWQEHEIRLATTAIASAEADKVQEESAARHRQKQVDKFKRFREEFLAFARGSQDKYPELANAEEWSPLHVFQWASNYDRMVRSRPQNEDDDYEDGPLAD